MDVCYIMTMMADVPECDVLLDGWVYTFHEQGELGYADRDMQPKVWTVQLDDWVPRRTDTPRMGEAELAEFIERNSYVLAEADLWLAQNQVVLTQANSIVDVESYRHRNSQSP
jgi:hypothetical protein